MIRFLADVLLVVHVAYVVFVVGGWVAIVAGGLLRRRWVRNLWFRFAHLLAIGIVAVQAVLGVPCPLTVWERDLRLAAGQNPGDLPFIPRMLQRVIFFEAPPELFTLIYVVFGGVVVISLFVLPPRRRNRDYSPRRSQRSDEAGTG